MAYNIFPKSEKELRDKIKSYPSDVQGELFLLYTYLKKKFPKVELPINMDGGKRNSANVTRMIESDITIKKIKDDLKLKKLSIKFGNGSSGNRGANNRGNLFEPQFADAMFDWWQGDKVSDLKMLAAVQSLEEEYKLSKNSQELGIDVVGGENTKRPLAYSPKIHITNPGGNSKDIGAAVTDITLYSGKKKVYLSLKLGTTTTFFNVGVKTVLPRTDIEAYDIKGDGAKLLDLFGIDHKVFCDVFNGRLSQGYSEKAKINASDMQYLLESGIGYGYHIIHKLTGKILSKKMDKAAMQKAARVTGGTIYYGGKGGKGKRIDIEMESSTYKFKLNLRDTQGKDGYPTRLMCDFSYK